MYGSSTKETKWVCIQLACSRRPRAFWGSPSLEYTSQVLYWKIPTSIWKWQNKRLSIMKIMVLLWSTSVEKRIVTLPLLSFSLIFYFYFIFWGLLFFWPFFFFLNLLFFLHLSLFLFPHTGQCSNNDDHHTSIYLQLKDYKSILEQNMTLYECL